MRTSLALLALLFLAPAPDTVVVDGAAGEVGGSLAVLTTPGARIVVDCGAFYGRSAEGAEAKGSGDLEQNLRLPADAARADAVVLTHAHGDHTGRLPLLCREGYRGPVHLTAGTAAIAPVMIEMAIRYDALRERDWVWSAAGKPRGERTVLHFAGCFASRRIQSAMKRTCRLADFEKEDFSGSPCSLCAAAEAKPITELFRVHAYGEAFDAGPGVRATLFDAGHIPGSACALFEFDVAGAHRRVLFSGDIGNDLSPIFAGPAPAPPADVVFVEATYGAGCRDPEVAKEGEEFRVALGEAVRDGKVAWVPAFALDRTQKVLYEIRAAQDAGIIAKDVPVFCPSPTARTISEKYRAAAAARAGWFRPEIEGAPWRLTPAMLDEEYAPDGFATSVPRPAILVTTSAMMDAALSRELVPELIPDEDVTVFIVGWQAPGSPGAQLREGKREVTLSGRRIPVRAKVRTFSGFSGHADVLDSDRWLSRQEKSARIVLVHGEPESLLARQKDLVDKGFTDVRIAAPGASIPLAPAPPAPR